jgi:hypothetical protein
VVPQKETQNGNSQSGFDWQKIKRIAERFLP